MMKAVVLVGGEGTRLRPLTYTMPKPMLQVAGMTILERVLHHLAKHGVDEAVLSLGYKPEPFLTAYPDGVAAGVKLHYAVESEPLDTAGAIAFAAREAGFDGETIVVVNGDVLTDNDVTALVKFHRDKGAEATISLTPVEDPSRFGVVPTDDGGRVLAFIEKPKREEAPTNLINAGTYVLEPSVLTLIPEGVRVSIERDTFPKLVAKGSVYALADNGYWVDAGTAAALLQVNYDVLAGKRGDTAVDSQIHANAVVAESATVRNTVIGLGVTVEAGAEVVNSVLLPGAHIGADAIVRDSIVAGHVGDGASVLDESVIGTHGVVEPGMSVHGARIPVAI